MIEPSNTMNEPLGLTTHEIGGLSIHGIRGKGVKAKRVHQYLE
jgi:hypothetical protein